MGYSDGSSGEVNKLTVLVCDDLVLRDYHCDNIKEISRKYRNRYNLTSEIRKKLLEDGFKQIWDKDKKKEIHGDSKKTLSRTLYFERKEKDFLLEVILTSCPQKAKEILKNEPVIAAFLDHNFLSPAAQYNDVMMVYGDAFSRKDYSVTSLMIDAGRMATKNSTKVGRDLAWMAYDIPGCSIISISEEVVREGTSQKDAGMMFNMIKEEGKRRGVTMEDLQERMWEIAPSDGDTVERRKSAKVIVPLILQEFDNCSNSVREINVSRPPPIRRGAEGLLKQDEGQDKLAL